MDYRLTYTGYPSVLEGYTDATWFSTIEDNSSTSGWVFLLGGGVISWGFKKQTCITGSIIEYEFVALATTGLPKFKYHKEHLCHSCEQGKIKRASHPPKPVPNSRQRLHLLHLDLYGPMRIDSINGKWDIWNAIKARFDENAEFKKMQKYLLKQKFEEFKISKEEGLDKGYDKMGLPPFWYGITLILKTKGRLKYISFDDLYNKLKFLEIDTKGYSSISSTLSNVAFISTAGSSQGNLSYQESRDGGYTTTFSVSPSSSSSKGSSKSKCSVVDDVIYSFFANHEIDQHLVYKDLDQMNKEDFEEYDLKHQMEMLSIKVHRFEKKHGRKIKFNGRQNERSLENFGMIAGIKIELDPDLEDEVVSANDAIPDGVFVSAGDVVVAVVSPQSEIEFALMGLFTKAHKHAVKILEKQIKCHQTNQLAYEEKIRVLSYELEEKSSILEYRQKLIDQAAQEKQDLINKLDNEIANQAKWNNSGELGIDDSKVSIFHTNNDELEGKPIYNSIECSRPNHSDHESTDSISSVSAPASESRDTIVIDCDRKKDFPSVCTSSIETDVKSSKTLCNKFGSFNKESHFRKHKSIASKSCYVCGSYLHLIKDYDLHEQRFAKRNAEGKGILGRRSTEKLVNPNRPKPVSAGQQNPVSTGSPNPVSAGQQNPVSTGQPNLVSAGDGILGNKDKLEDFEDFDGEEVTFGGSTGKISGKGTIKTNNLNFENVLYVKELQHFNLISVSQICDQTHRVLFTENECLVLSKDFPLPDPSMVILSSLRKHNLYTFSLNELTPKGPLTCLISKALQNESTLWHRRLGHVNF
nr:zinc finger, CCHC-type [Tanacetum cinerariifolium]